jgi:hypothetical protein
MQTFDACFPRTRTGRSSILARSPQANSGTIARFLTRFLNGRSLSNYCRTCFADFKKKAARVNGRPEAPLGEDQKA